jgi:type II secretory pathway pseudopilin PulG
MRIREVPEETERIAGEIVQLVQRHSTERNYNLDFHALQIRNNGYLGAILTISFTHRTITYQEHIPRRPILDDFDVHSPTGYIRTINDPETYSVSVVIEPNRLRIQTDTIPSLASAVISNLDEHMRDWNNRNAAQQAQQREQQRREARAQIEYVNTTNDEVDWRPQMTSPNQSSYWSLQTSGIVNTSSYIQSGLQDRQETGVTKDQVLALIKAALADSLDIRISMDESDGEITAEVEVLFEGKVIAEDKDSIQL